MTKKTIVWRVEREDQYGRHLYAGPYQSIFFTGHADEETHPAPQCDRYKDDGVSYLGIHEDEFCGTATLRELAEWFDGYGEKLASKGYKVVALKVSEKHVRRGRRQVVFKRDHARVLRTMDPTWFIKSKMEVK